MNSLLKKAFKQMDKESEKTQMMICHLYAKVNEATKKNG